MTKYEAHFVFGSNTEENEAREWFDMLKDALPDGTEATLKRAPMMIDVEKLLPEHYGSHVSLYVPKHGTVSGKLDAVYPAGVVSTTLVIDGKAYTTAYGVAQLEW